MFIAYVSTQSRYRTIADGYLLVEADNKEQAKEKIEKFYKQKWPEHPIDKIQIGETIL